MGAWVLSSANPRRFPEACVRLGAHALFAAACACGAINRNRKKTVSAVLLCAAALLFWRSLPDPLFRSPFSVVVEAHDGRLLGARIAADGQWRFPEAPCPERFARAAMVYEDSRFLWHPGIDPLAILRAAAKNAKSGKVRSGASTLTMQVVRLSRPGKPRTLWQKGLEALLALRLELAYGKSGILDLYAAHAPFGGNVVGLPAASWRYFGRGPESLSWGEAALLAVLPNNPALMHPGRNREPLRKKRDRLLRRLWQAGVIDSLTSALARLEPLPEKPRPLPRHAPHLLQTLASGRLGGPASVHLAPARLGGPIPSRLATSQPRYSMKADPPANLAAARPLNPSAGLYPSAGSWAAAGAGLILAAPSLGNTSFLKMGFAGFAFPGGPGAPTNFIGIWERVSAGFRALFPSATNGLGSSWEASPQGLHLHSQPAPDPPDHQSTQPSTQSPIIRSGLRSSTQGSAHRPDHPAAQSAPERSLHMPGDGSAPTGRFRTTLDYDLQVQVGGILARKRRQWEAMGIGNAAVLVLHTPTGEVLAYCGNLPARDSAGAGQEVDVVTARRSTGSLLKPFLYAAMLEAGEILPGTLVPDVPTHIAGFTPENFDRDYEGAVPAKLALARSLNVPAVRMLKDHGIDRFLHTLRALGLASADRPAGDYGLTLVLGGGEGTLWELTGMYAGLAREAQRSRRTFFPPRVLADGAAAAGHRSAAASADPDPGPAHGTRPGGGPGAHSPSPSGLIGPAAAWLALEAMAEVSRPDAEQHWRSFASSRWVAWKTGTSFGFRDAWAVGVTPEVTVGVWVGNASGEGRPGMTGIQVAAPVLFETFNLLPATTEFAKPMASLARIPVCARSGMRPSPRCPPADSADVPLSGLRTAACPYHRIAHLDAGGRRQVHDGCESVSAMRHEPWFVLPPAQEWYYRRRHGDYLPLPPWREDCAEGALALRPKAMDLLYPRAGANIYVPVELDARKGRTVFEAVHRERGSTVFWHLDETYLGQTREFHKWAVDPAPGRHVLLLVDDRGERLEQAFEVMAREEAVAGRGRALP